jgi:dephospho-CoA kinase
MRIGLTGGIASGKTTVSDLFAERGITVIDADVVAHQLVEPGQPALKDIIHQFGVHLLDDQGRLDRQQMRRMIFDDPQSRATLERIIHPRVREALLLQSSASQSAYCILSIPLLVENGLQSMVDRVLVVDVDPAIQKQRLLARDAGSTSQADAILAAQATREQRLAVADDVIDNNGEQSRLPSQVNALHSLYLELLNSARAKPL